MQADLTIRRVKDRLHRRHIRDVGPGLKAYDCCVSAVDELAHLGKAQTFSKSPFFHFHATYVRVTHISVKDECVGHIH